MSRSLKDGLQRTAFRWLWLTLMLCYYRPDAAAQLAITEVMSAASTSLEGSQRPDFWELTNFGTNAASLAGYKWFDGDERPSDAWQSFPATDINPGESIVFVKESTVVRDEHEFREWWGLPAEVRVYYWLGAPGFDGDAGDAVRIWDKDGNLVDEVRFDSARLGVSFTYDTNSGAFSDFSLEGVEGAFRAAKGGDIGSPGCATNGPVTLRITQEPISQTVAPGSEVILRVQATGRPSVQSFQWYFNDNPTQSSGSSTFAIPRLVCFADCGNSWRRAPNRGDLVLTAIQPEKGGEYFVEIFNGLERRTSAKATLTVDTNPSPVQVQCPPEESCAPCAGTNSLANLVASPGQTAIFTVQNSGYPLPTFQWSRSVDGVTFADLHGETSRDLVISNVQYSNACLYRVRLQNSLGTASAFARLTVKARPRLEITEVMSQACSALDRDWWELTNTGAEPVNLCGYRWDDETTENPTTGELGIGGGPTITNDVTLRPGESVILLESQTAESFVQWWGASNLPPDLRFVTYAANGLGPAGDFIYVWDPNETDAHKYAATVVFSGAIEGFTRWYDSVMVVLEGCKFAEAGVISTKGNCGAFQAARGCEIGSPGWTRWTPPTLTSVRREGNSVVLSWSAQPGSENKVQFTRRLADPPDATIWEDMGAPFKFPSAACFARDSNIGVESQRYYRVMRVAVASCPCPAETLH